MSKENLKTYKRLPDHLKEFVVEQNYSQYSWRDQATWRYIMRQSREYFKGHAHEIYLLGLKKTGIPLSSIPDIEKMDTVLNEFGWGAVCVCGFIPPLAFLDFQALHVLPIAADMRTLEHIAYTPAPDIVHEAAGHAPIIADDAYAIFLKRYAKLARRSIFSHEDIKLYEAIRVLSDVKENPDSTLALITKAEKGLDEAVASMTWVSEAAQVARMYWWTAEYGLVGSCESPKIFGAGLLSSLSESRTCMDAEVRKIPLSVDCINQSYDITKPQPQLFVARDFKHLVEVLGELEAKMSFVKGGVHGLSMAKKAKALTTTVLDSGLCISGICEEFRAEGERIGFVKWQGPVQLAFKDHELPGHGRSRHGHGFSTPCGTWKHVKKHPSELTDEDLEQIGICKGKQFALQLNSGASVDGLVSGWLRKDGHLLLLTFEQCTVRYGDEIVFDPTWGPFDLAIGTKIESVYGGPADWEKFGEYNFGKASTVPGRSSPYSTRELKIFDTYQSLRQIRESSNDEFDLNPLKVKIKDLSQVICNEFPDEWLLGVEVFEILHQVLKINPESSQWAQELRSAIQSQHQQSHQAFNFIEKGFNLAAVPD
ncbi:MAG: aromatic amino acid hydroxylase [Oligoflexales bacterium]